MNKQLGNGQHMQAIEAYEKATEGRGKASECVGCKQCENACPQHLPITRFLDQCRKELELES